MYAYSNAGSLLGLLSYPLLVEPSLTLAGQARLWSWLFAGFALAMAALGASALRIRRAERRLRQSDWAERCTSQPAVTTRSLARRSRRAS